MFLKAAYRRWPEYREGLRDQGAVGVGIAAWGLMTGVAMVQSGVGPWDALIMVVLVYAGSAQLAATPMLLAGAPLWVILAAACCVNLRFVVFSAHMRPYVMHMPLRQRMWTAYFTGDISYALFVKRYPQPGHTPEALERQQAYLAGNCAVNYSCWMSGSLLGVVLAHAIPMAWGLGFAGVLALLGVGCSFVTNRLRALSAGVAGTAAVAAWALPLKLYILVAIAVAVALCLIAEAHGPRWLRGSVTPKTPHRPHARH